MFVRTIIDVATGRATPQRSILIHNAQIAVIGPAIRAAPTTRIIDASGKFVIPGLWDMHVNLTARDQLPAYPLYGVTDVRDMGSDSDRVNLLIGSIETWGPPIDGIPSGDSQLPMRVVRTAAEARSVYNQLDGESISSAFCPSSRAMPISLSSSFHGLVRAHRPGNVAGQR